MQAMTPEENEQTLIDTLPPMDLEGPTTWPSPPPSPISSNPPPSLAALPALRAPALPRGVQLNEDEPAE